MFQLFFISNRILYYPNVVKGEGKRSSLLGHFYIIQIYKNFRLDRFGPSEKWWEIRVNPVFCVTFVLKRMERQ